MEQNPGTRTITIYDTTLRDGAQAYGISFSVQDKVRIALELDRLRFDFIEGGWPGSNPKDDLFFSEIKKEQIEYARIVAFSSTIRPKKSYKEDEIFQTLLGCGAANAAIVAKSWDFHVTAALGITLDENLELIRTTIACLKDHGMAAFLDAEHFFDGYKANPDYAVAVLHAAADAGADMLVLCDTNGGSMPGDIPGIVSAVVAEFGIPVGIHCHNDSGLAVANSILAVEAGVQSVQGTMNGYGERCGNCDLTMLVPNLALKMGYGCAARERLRHLTEVSRQVSEIANMAHDERAPFVGDNAFAHKGGIHVSALAKDTRTYEHIDPALVGNRRRVLVSELAGRSNILFKAKELGIDLDNRVDLSKEILRKIKSLEDQGFQFEGAEGSFELLIRGETGEYVPFFTLRGFRIITEKNGDAAIECEASIKVEVGGRIEHTAANGNGPVSALDNALRKALEKFYPEIAEMRLTDYKVRVLDEKAGTGAAVRVLIDHKRHTQHWGSVGVSENIIEASWLALVDGVEFMLYKSRNS